uniref:F-box domain-containing protein n=1 Tax=Schizophyllum commune (strain H4-8 / FGSC 9210) TaxID=578458 RepID=D8PTX5_SCHCM
MRRSSRLSKPAVEAAMADDAATDDHDEVVASPLPEEPDSEDDGATTSKPPARKRRKTKASTNEIKAPRPRKRGKLSALPDMPMDILYEIFRSLHPSDLLHLARTTKAFRSLLMNRSSAWLWKDGYAAYADDLPPIPGDLTIPQFMSLAYDRICHFCNAPSGVTTIVWDARVRTCKKCLNVFVTETSRDQIFKSLAECLPVVTVRTGNRSVERLYPAHLVKQLAHEYASDAKDQGWQWKETSAWFRERSKQHMAKVQHAKSCEKWHAAREKERGDELKQSRDSRQADILRRMTDLGWGDEIQMLGVDKFGKYKHVRKSQKLTEKMWLQIKDELVEYMEEVKRTRLEEEKRETRWARYRLLVEVYTEYRVAQPLDTILPNVGDIAIIDEVSHIIEGTPWDQELTKTDLRAVLDAIPKSFFDDWLHRCETALVQVLNTARRKKRATRADLKLAATAFGIKNYSRELHYPSLLVDDTMTKVYMSEKDKQRGEVHILCGHKPWSAERLIPSYHYIAKKVVTLAGLDPSRATGEDMDKRDPWSWRNMVACTDRGTRFELLGDDETALARAEVAKTKGIPIFHGDNGEKGMCAHCEKCFANFKDLEAHLRHSHQRKRITKKDFVMGMLYNIRGHCVELPKSSTTKTTM